MVGGSSRDEDAPGLRQTFNAGSDVHAVAIDVLAIDNDVTDVDSNPKLDPFFCGTVGIVFTNRFLDLDRAGDGIDRAGKLDERSVAHQFDHATRMRGDRWVDDLAPQRLEARQCSRLINLHETRIANHIGRKDGRESPLDTRFGHSICNSSSRECGFFGSVARAVTGKTTDPRRSSPVPKRLRNQMELSVHRATDF
jgi:hypothetical protein